MKARDIRSFFSKPGGSGTNGSSSSRSADTAASEQIVEIPSRLKKGDKKKSKEDDVRRRDNSDDEDDEDPLPTKARGRKKDQGEGGKSKSKKKKAVIVDDDSEDEDPLPKSARNKKKEEKQKSPHEKKRKARVLSDSDDDDFKAASQAKAKAEEKPALKIAKVEKQVEKKKEEPKLVNPGDFFSSAPVKREAKETQGRESKPMTRASASPAKNEVKSSPVKKESSSSLKTPPKSNQRKDNSPSPQRPPTSMIEPRKLRMESASPGRKEKSDNKSHKSASPAKVPESKSRRTPVKDEPKFKTPTPVAAEKSKSRTGTGSVKRSVPDDDDDEEEDFNPKKKAATPSTSKQDKAKPKRDKKTPAKDSSDDGEPSAKQQNYMKFLAKKDMKPKNLGSKDIPEGAPNCLEGLAFVVSGILDSLEREDCKDLIVKYGGRLTSAISGKTNYLIVGDEPGESKINQAVQRKIPQIDEDQLLDMIRKSNPNANSQDSGLDHSEGMSADSEPMKSDYDADMSLFDSPASKKGYTPKKLESSKLAKKDESPKKSKTVEPMIKKEVKQEAPSTSKSVLTSDQPTDAGLMWVDKYKPKMIKNVVGQASDASNARKLVRWLTNWFNYHGTSQDKPKASWPGLKDPEGKTFKAALLSGPPGIGKTTSAHLAVKEVGYDYFELNASDTRNKRGLRENVADALSSKSLVFGKTDDMTRKHVLIMDEVDGMSGNEDRGGVQELIGLIKTSRVPIVCICNDRNHPKIRSLANYCFDLRFNKPSFEQLKGFIMSICFKEGIKIPPEKVKQLIISTDNDVRQILHQLELFKEGKSNEAYNPKKDLRFGPWDVVRKVFLKSDHEKMSIHDKNGLFFQDYNIGPLFVQENYIRWTPARAKGNGCKHMDLIWKTAASLGDADLVETTIRRSQNWGLLPVQAVFGSYLPGEYMVSDYMGGVEFPHWLGKNSNKNKRQRLLQSLHSHLHLQVSGSLEALNMDYLPYLRKAITKPLIDADVTTAAQVMEDYTLLRDDLDCITELSLWPGTKDPMERVDTKTKTAFTRTVNKEMLPYSTVKPVKRGRGGGGQEEDLEALLDEEGEGAAVEEEEDESVEKDAMVKMRTKKAGSSKAASSTSAKSKKGKSKGEDYEDDDEDIKPISKGKSKQASSSKPRKGK